MNIARLLSIVGAGFDHIRPYIGHAVMRLEPDAVAVDDVEDRDGTSKMSAATAVMWSQAASDAVSRIT
jgi:hypothetical protein